MKIIFIDVCKLVNSSSAVFLREKVVKQKKYFDEIKK